MAVIHETLLPEDAAPEVRRWTLEEFIRLDELGFFPEDTHWELLDGQLYKKMGQNEPHIFATLLVQEALRLAFGNGFSIWSIPLHIGGAAPEPDVAVLRGGARQLEAAHIPSEDVALVVEVADSRLDTAKGVKVPLYARLGIAEYWILDLRKRILEVRRGPRTDGQWTETHVYGESDSVQALAGSQPVKVADLLPSA